MYHAEVTSTSRILRAAPTSSAYVSYDIPCATRTHDGTRTAGILHTLLDIDLHLHRTQLCVQRNGIRRAAQPRVRHYVLARRANTRTIRWRTSPLNRTMRTLRQVDPWRMDTIPLDGRHIAAHTADDHLGHRGNMDFQSVRPLLLRAFELYTVHAQVAEHYWAAAEQ